MSGGGGPQGVALGGQIMRCQLAGYGELFYQNPLALLDGSAPIRGGVPVLFPQFAGQGPLPKHGLVRTQPWQLIPSPDQFAAHLSLAPNAQWPGQADLALHAQADDHALTITLTITNRAEQPLQWTGGLHPYFALDARSSCQIQGLSAHHLIDRLGKQPLSAVAVADALTGCQEIEWLVTDAAPLVLAQAGRRLQLSMQGFTEWMIWNPGQTAAAGIKDLPSNDWQKFICIEPVCVSQPLTIQPGDYFVGSLRLARC